MISYDFHYSAVSLLLHGEGANGSTTFHDSGPVGIVPTTTTGVVLSTAQYKFGAGSLYNASNTTGAIELPYNTALVLGTGDFTIEFFARPASYGGIFGNEGATGGTVGAFWLYNTATTVTFDIGGTAQVYSNTQTIALNVWRYYTITRLGNVFRLFLDGVLIATVTQAINFNSTNPFRLFTGLAGSGIEFHMTGYIDEFRVTKGVARYISTFAPPTAPHGDSDLPDVTPVVTISVDKAVINKGEMVRATVGYTNATSSVDFPLYWTTQGTATAASFVDDLAAGSFLIHPVDAGIELGFGPNYGYIDWLLHDTGYLYNSPVEAFAAFIAAWPSTSLNTHTVTTLNDFDCVITSVRVSDGYTEYLQASIRERIPHVTTILSNGVGVLPRTALIDRIPSPSKTFTISVRSGSVSGTILATSITITILDELVVLPEIEIPYDCAKNKYVMLIPNNNNQQPNFRDVVCLETKPFIEIGVAASALVPVYFDLDLASGAQLDVIGEWVGLSRRLSIVLDNIYFSWDSLDAYKGWDAGKWKGLYENDAGATLLPDDLYRALIKAKILANHWDGTIAQAYKVWKEALPNGQSVTIFDNQDMTMTTTIGSTPPLTATEIAVINSGVFNLKPVGVANIIVGVPSH